MEARYSIISGSYFPKGYSPPFSLGIRRCKTARSAKRLVSAEPSVRKGATSGIERSRSSRDDPTQLPKPKGASGNPCGMGFPKRAPCRRVTLAPWEKHILQRIGKCSVLRFSEVPLILRIVSGSNRLKRAMQISSQRIFYELHSDDQFHVLTESEFTN